MPPGKTTKTPIYLSGPGAVRGTAPIVTKAPSKPIVTKPKAKTLSPLDKLKSDFDKLNKLVDQFNAGNNEELPASGGGLPVVDPALEYQKAQDEKARQDAFNVLRTTLEGYGLGSLADTLTRMFKSGLTANEALVKMKYDKTIDPATGKAWNAAYTLRFAGNEKRLAKGLNALGEAEYIANEDSYAETLRAYGLGNMLSTDRLVNEAKFSDYIGNDMSPVEFKDRVSTAADRVINADAAIKQTFQQFYPNLSNNDLIAYFLNPSDTIGKLKEKATAAEIGAAALGQGLGTNVENAEMLAKYGVDRTSALQGYQQIAEFLPTAEKLGNIYKEWGTNYTQAKGEAEIFKNNEEAARERKRFKSLERAAFGADSGVNKTTFSKLDDF